MAQTAAKVPRIGVLSGASRDKDPCLQRLQQGLRELGYVDGQAYVLDGRWADGRQESFPRLAGELVKAAPDVIVAFTSDATLAVKQSTTTIPVVVAVGTYPVELGLVKSLARPGGNVTGLATFTPDLMAKRVQILKEAVPSITRVAVIREPGQRNDLIVHDYEQAAQKLGITVRAIQVKSRDELPAAFETAARWKAQAVMTTQGPFFGLHAKDIADLAQKHRLPSFSGELPLGPEAGILLSYGPAPADDCQRAAGYVDRVLKGAKPADLPAEQPTRIESVVNLRTAKALDLKIPQPVLLRATRVIE